MGKQKFSSKSSRSSRRSPPVDGEASSYYRGDVNEFGEVEAEARYEDPYTFLNEYINARMYINGSRDADPNFTSVEESMNNYSESIKSLLKGLTALGQLHPFVGVAVGAFALVVTLDLTRRDNDKKVKAVNIQMMDLMIAFLDLRYIRSSDETGPDDLTIGKRLESLVKEVTKDVTHWGAACDAYQKKNFLAKTVKAPIYETRLSEIAACFTEHRKTLLTALAIHTSLGVDSANKKLNNHNIQLQAIHEKLDMVLLFRKLDTPREKDIQKFIEQNGGAKNCINNTDLLKELLAKSGESFFRFPGHESSRRSDDLPEVKKKLLKEMQEDVDEAFSRNMILFERKLDMQRRQLRDVVHEEADHVINTLRAGAHDRIMDPDLQTIWKDMAWKGSVKARHFVLALHDYYTDKLSTPETPSRKGSMPLMPVAYQDDRWPVTYINAAYIQPILEAVDDDSTGFVSIKEVNTFVAGRPKNWSLPHWIAYWAVGWQMSMSRYKDKIYGLVQTMFATLEAVLSSNRRIVDEYLWHPSFWKIELLLRSTRSAGSKILSDPDLSKMTESYEREEEERLDQSLRAVNYELDTHTTVSLITGAGRIERYIFPLIYLLLRHHLQVIKLACKHVLHKEEFTMLNDSLVSILIEVDHRVQNVEAIFKQTHLDVQGRLGNFAFGIFQLSYGETKRTPAENSFASWDGLEGSSRSTLELSTDGVKNHAADISHDILKHGIQDGYSVTNYFEFDHLGLGPDTTSLEGTWTGHYRRRYGNEWLSCLLRISMRLTSANTMAGKGEDFAGAFEFEGTMTHYQDSFLKFSFIVQDKKDGTSQTCTGYLDKDSGIITGQWKTTRRDGTLDEGNHPFTLKRTSPSLSRYRYTDRQFAEDPARSRWSFACSAALHQARKALWSRRFFEERFTERKRYVELTTRALIVQMGLTPQVPLTPPEKGELEYLRQELNPSEARFYQALAEFEIQKLPWHPSYGCDWCELHITKSRILCIQCISEDLSDNIELCSSCVDRAPTKRNFIHEVSHAVVKVEQTLHDYHIVKVVAAARATYDRVKAIFQSLDPTLPHHQNGQALHKGRDSQKTSPHCACCGKGVLPPCWACVICTKDVFICTKCDTKQLARRVEGHSLRHALVRIRDTSIVGHSISVDDHLLALEQKLLSMEYRVNERSSAMQKVVENKVDQLLGSNVIAEQRITSLEARLDQRFVSLEAVLRQIAAQTVAPPTLSSEVIRGHKTRESASVDNDDPKLLKFDKQTWFSVYFFANVTLSILVIYIAVGPL